jgi:hypothetical protein
MLKISDPNSKDEVQINGSVKKIDTSEVVSMYEVAMSLLR